MKHRGDDMKTYTYEDRLKEIRSTDADAMKQNDLAFMEFYQKIKNLEGKLRNAGGKVVIVGDYDCDGICSSYILKKMFPDAVVCLGDRYKYGYGIPTDLPVGENDLVICTDVGTNDINTLSMINKTLKACPVVIDHHEFEVESMKKYKFILNFNKDGEKERRPDYCATGLAYKLYEVDYRATHKDDEKELNTVKAIAAIGTIADMVKVNNPYDDNRRIILEGFDAMRNADFDKDNFDETLGYILDKCGISENPYSITTDVIQMKVAPLFNSPSRMKQGGAMEFFNALTSPLLNERGQIVEKTVQDIEVLFELNRERIERKKDAFNSPEYKEVLNDEHPIKVYVNDELPIGLNGLIASNLTELTGKPAIVFCKTPDGNYAGSGRNAAGYPSILETVKKAGINTLKLGGHDDAFGLTVAPEEMQGVIDRLHEYFKTVEHEDVELAVLDYTAKKGASAPVSFDEMMRLEPFGIDFPKIRVDFNAKLSEFGVKTADIKREDNPPEYRKFSVGGITYTTFSAGERLKDLEDLDEPVHIAGELNINTYKDRKNYQVIFDVFEDERVQQKQPVPEKNTDMPDFP